MHDDISLQGNTCVHLLVSDTLLDQFVALSVSSILELTPNPAYSGTP